MSLGVGLGGGGSNLRHAALRWFSLFLQHHYCEKPSRQWHMHLATNDVTGDVPTQVTWIPRVTATGSSCVALFRIWKHATVNLSLVDRTRSVSQVIGINLEWRQKVWIWRPLSARFLEWAYLALNHLSLRQHLEVCKISSARELAISDS